MTVHVATWVQIPVLNGVAKKATDMTIGERMQATSLLRVNITDYPTLETYLATEAASGYKLQHMDQTYIITYKD